MNQFSPEMDYSSIASVQFSDENNGWAAGYIFLRTTDGGENWTECPVDGRFDMWVTVNSLCFADENNGGPLAMKKYIKLLMVD